LGLFLSVALAGLALFFAASNPHGGGRGSKIAVKAGDDGTQMSWLKSDEEYSQYAASLQRTRPSSGPSSKPQETLQGRPIAREDSAVSVSFAERVLGLLPDSASYKLVESSSVDVNGKPDIAVTATFEMPSGDRLTVLKQQLPAPVQRSMMGDPTTSDYARLASGSEILTLNGVSPYSQQTVLVRPSGVMLNVTVRPSEPGARVKADAESVRTGIAAMLDSDDLE
jgi:hypothetical protein